MKQLVHDVDYSSEEDTKKKLVDTIVSELSKFFIINRNYCEKCNLLRYEKFHANHYR